MGDEFLDYLKEIGLPRITETILFPCNGRITYDSISLMNISYGGGVKSSISSQVREVRAKHGIIESLPIPRSSEDSDLIALRGYTSSKQSIYDYWDDCWEILNRKPEYLSVFYQRMGEVYARIRRKELKREGIESGWFALFGHMIISGGKSREIVEESAMSLIPVEKKDFIYYFQIQVKKKGR
jgi:hypothetical protein